ncbi:MAG: diacylglycerol kinase family lipid kinase [Armatimonadota bacterium]|nr:diacylglycerol kinase family lipid kinase [Armatimonadota bacterium]MDR7438807.1 diacylglycerol kinase family lipid kinase [Armatimonadota bacterium]MDR7562097.1 diacylglycerol kinase family lipid kinase [Armatimonadota bacterium]MDR7568330.1 diacylglycerol kinase family lipid kinase [Armatimonadota bacterium]MDR7601943.1 diacylglycerol kinase family lipid kinase [Armatimonadota bacterium]
MKVLAIINPVAGRGRARKLWPRLRAHFVQAGWSVEEVYSTGRGHAVELAASALDCDGILAVGGDGTCNEVANGLLRASSAPARFLAPLPVGTANDFATCMGVPGEPEAAARALVGGRLRRIDVGWVNGRFFLTIAGCGFDAEVARRVNQWPKLLGGKGMYVAGIFHQLAAFRPVRMEISMDQRVWIQPTFMLAAGNLPCYAGGLRMCPEARPDDGWLEVVLVREVSRVEVVRLLPRLLDGSHVRHPKVEVMRAKEVEVRSIIPVAVHADGEFVGTTPARFTIHPQTLEVLLPVSVAERVPLRAAQPARVAFIRGRS